MTFNINSLHLFTMNNKSYSIYAWHHNGDETIRLITDLKTLEQSVMCAEEMKREDDTISCYEVLLNNETVANGWDT